MSHTIQETLQFILQSITQHDETISVDTRQEGEVLILEIIAPPEKIGQIIGKQGRIIKSIRTILNLSYPDLRYSLDIKE